MLAVILLLCLLIAPVRAATMPRAVSHQYRTSREENSRRSPYIVAAVLPGDPLITGTLSGGVVTSISLFSNVLLARFALSWFPQVMKQFPVLKPIITGKS